MMKWNDPWICPFSHAFLDAFPVVDNVAAHVFISDIIRALLSGWLRLDWFLLHLEAGKEGYITYIFGLSGILHTPLLPLCHRVILLSKCPADWKKKEKKYSRLLRPVCLNPICLVLCPLVLGLPGFVCHLPRHCLNVTLLAHTCFAWLLPNPKRRKYSTPFLRSMYNN